MQRFNWTALVMVSLGCVYALAADPPQLVNFQGVLRDSAGKPLSGSYDMSFAFYDEPSGGEILLTDSHAAGDTGAVAVSNGLFSVQLGAGRIGPGLEPTLGAVFERHAEVYISVHVGEEVLAPRMQVVSSAYAQSSRYASDSAKWNGWSAPTDSAGVLSNDGNGGLTWSRGGEIYLPVAGGRMTGPISFADNYAGYAVAMDPPATGLGLIGISFDVGSFSGVPDPVMRWGYNARSSIPNHPRVYWALEGWYYDQSINKYWTETYLERINEDGTTIRPFGIGTYEGHADAFFNVDSLTIRSRSGADCLHVSDGLVQVLNGNQICLASNDTTGIIQKNSAGGYTGLVKLSSADRWLISPDSAPVDVKGTLSLIDGSDNRWTLAPRATTTVIAYTPSNGVSKDVLSLGYSGNKATLGLLADGDANQILSPNGTIRIISAAPPESIILGNTSSNVSVTGDLLSVGSVYAKKGVGEIRTYDTWSNNTLRLESTQATAAINWGLKWRNDVDARNGDDDTSIFRAEPGYLEIGDGAANANGSIRLRSLIAAEKVTAFGFQMSSLPPIYENDEAAVAGGMIAGQLYRDGLNPDHLCIVHSDQAVVEVKRVEKKGNERVPRQSAQQSSKEAPSRSTIPSQGPRISWDKSIKARSGQEVAVMMAVAWPIEAGEVLVADKDIGGILHPSMTANDPLVVGIVAGQPGLLLGTSDSSGDIEAQTINGNGEVMAPVVFFGVAMCKVDAGAGPILTGDLLVSSTVPGHAMRAQSPAIGTVVGKALEPLLSGRGVIKVLVMIR